MEVIRVLNNNAVLCTDGCGQTILLGRGLGFGKRLGDVIDPSEAEQVFVPNAALSITNLTQLSADIPLEMIQLAAEIAHLVGRRDSQALVLALADHISFAVERATQNIAMEYPLRWEISQLFPAEFALGQKALKLINDRTGCTLPGDEAALLAMHFVNAQFNRLGVAHTLPHTLTDVLRIVESGIGFPLDRDSIDVARFITHLRYLFVRLEQGKLAGGPMARLSAVIAQEAPASYAVAQQVAAELKPQHGELSANEIGYLALHIERLARVTNEKVLG